jgi:DNA-binding CsgD family transcriptional regulator/tetratricopeptide (TPR) repeat protein
MDLVERELLLGRLEAAAAEGGRVLLIAGEAGAGKTALIRTFLGRWRGRRVVGGCEPLRTPEPFGPFLEIAGRLDGFSSVAAGTQPRRVALALLEALASPTVVVVEDVHWADEATLDVLRFVGRRIGRTRSTMLVTFRDEEFVGSHPLGLLLGDLATEESVERVTVERLSRGAVVALASERGMDGDAVFERTHGNAFFVTELLSAGDVATLPISVRDAVLARVRRLGADAQALLARAALLPGRAELVMLEAAFPELILHLDESVSAGVLEERQGWVQFRHELARLAVESTLAPQSRRAAHGAILRALKQEPVADVSRLAHHAGEAGSVEDVLRYGRVAADDAARSGAHREAQAHLTRVLVHASRLGEEERADVYAAHAAEAQASGAYEQAASSWQHAVALRRAAGDVRRAGEHLARATTTYIILGRNEAAEAASRSSIDLLETIEPTPELADAYVFQAYVRMISRDNEAAIVWARKAKELAGRFERHETIAHALNMEGTASMMAGRIAEGRALLEQSLDLAEAHDLEQRVAHAHWMLGSGAAEMYELELGERSLRRHIAFAEERDLDSTYTRAWLAAVHAYRGRWDEAEQGAQQVLASHASPVAQITANVALGRVRARRGVDAAAPLEDAHALAAPTGHLQRIAHVQCARAESAWLAGDIAAAGHEAASAYQVALEKRHVWFAGELAYWQWKAGQLEDAPQWIAEPFRLQISRQPEAAARLWAERGCPYEAARALAESHRAEAVRDALATFESLGAVPAAAHARDQLRALGAPVPRGPRPATRANPALLTPRELDVLRLVAIGRRNGEIAEELVLSRRTVDHHVSALLRKLGAATRGEAVALAQRLGVFQDR